MTLVAGGEQCFGQLTAGDILTAFDLFEHDLLFFTQFVRVEGRMLDSIGHDGESCVKEPARQRNVVDRMVKRGISVDIATGALDLLSDFPDPTAPSALKEHMFIDM